MTVSQWVFIVCMLGMSALVTAVSVDRNRLKQRMNNAEGRVTGLTLDLDAVRERVAELTSYLGHRSNWEVGATPPSALVAAAPDRWSPRGEQAPAREAAEQIDAPGPTSRTGRSDPSLPADQAIRP